MKSRTFFVPLLFLFFLSSLQGSGGQICSPLTNIFVKSGSSDSGCCGQDLVEPCGTLTRALERVSDGGNVTLLRGTFALSSKAPLELSGKSLTVVGFGKPAETAVDCGQGPCLSFATVSSGKSLTMIGFTVQNGQSAANGGCLSAVGVGTVTLSNMIFKNCTAKASGGALAFSGTNSVSLSDVSILSSSAAGVAPTSGDDSLGGDGGGGVFVKNASSFYALRLSVSGGSASSGNGGGAYLSGTRLVSIAESTFTSCSAAANGGGVHTQSCGSVEIFQRTSFSACRAATGGGYTDLSSSSVTLRGVSFLLCTSTLAGLTTIGGGGFCLSSSMQASLTNVRVSNCSSVNVAGGGVIRKTPKALVSNSTFQFSTASGYQGGGLYLLGPGEFNVEDSDFLDNSMSGMIAVGVGLYMSSGTFSVRRSNFVRNIGSAMLTTQGGGACLDFAQAIPPSLFVEDCLFQENDGVMGSALFAADTVEVRNSRFVGNGKAYGSSGGGANLFGTSIFTNCTFEDNVVSGQGGALTYTSIFPNLAHTIRNCTFKRNGGLSTDGGAIYVSNSPLTLDISGSVFDDNYASTSTAGAISLGGTAMTISDTLFRRNSAASKGGAIGSTQTSATGLPSTFTFSNCVFENNRAPLGGGAVIALVDHSSVFENCVFKNNNSTTGGALDFAGYTMLQMKGGTCRRNTASTGGGCLSLSEAASGNISDTTFAANAAVSEGGAVYITGDSTLTLSGGSFVRNAAGWGAGIWAQMSSSVQITGVQMSDNHATFEGGAIYATHSSLLSINSSSFFGNRGLHGGVMSLEADVTAVLADSQFLNNSVSVISAFGNATIDVSRCNFSRNSAMPSSSGGAIFLSDTCHLSLSDSLFSANVAGFAGGAVDAEGVASAVAFSKNTFSNNQASISGGAVCVSGNDQFTDSGSVYQANYAPEGGALAVLEGAGGSVQKSQFIQNSASSVGSAVFIQRYQVDATSTDASAEEASANNATITSSDASLSALHILSFSNLSFQGNGANNNNNNNLTGSTSGGSLVVSSFFEASYLPRDRSKCVNCTLLGSTDTIATVPKSFYVTWPGINNGTSATDQVYASVSVPISNMKVVLLDSYGGTCMQDSSSQVSVLPDPRISGILKGIALNGIASLPDISVSVDATQADTPFNISITLSSPANQFPDVTQSVIVRLCSDGYYFSNNSLACEICPVGSWCAAGQPVVPCLDGSFSFYPGAKTQAGCTNVTDPNLQPVKGQLIVPFQIWIDPETLNTSNPTSYQCLNSNGCEGYQYVGPNGTQCGLGYREDVPLCSLCKKNFFLFEQYCEKCTDIFKDYFVILFILIIALWFMFQFLADTFTSMDLFLTEAQLLVLTGSTYLNYPGYLNGWVLRLFQVFDLAIFDPDVIAPDCLINYHYERRYFVGMMIPFIGLLIFAILYARHKMIETPYIHVFSFRKEKRKDAALTRSITMRRASNEYCNSIIHASLKWLDVCYCQVLIKCCLSLQAQLIGKKTVMQFAPYIEWLSPAHVGVFVPSIALMLVYIIGLPAFFAYILIHGKMNNLLDTTEFKQKYGWLTDKFTRRYFWWHMLTMGLRILYVCVLVFLVDRPNVQMVIWITVQLLRIAADYKYSPFSSLSLVYLQSMLALGEFFYIVGIIVFNFINLSDFSEAVFGISATLMFLPGLLSLLYEGVNMHMEFVNANLLSRMWKKERKKPSLKEKFKSMDPYDIVDPKDIAQWFRPHVLFTLFLTRRTRERKLLLRVRERFETCQMAGLGNTEWLAHLKKPQLYAVLSQALLGASAGHITVARVPKRGVFCKLHGTWHTEGDACSQAADAARVNAAGGPLAGQPVATAGKSAWASKLERHTSWGSQKGTEMEMVSRLALTRVDGAADKASGLGAIAESGAMDGGAGSSNGQNGDSRNPIYRQSSLQSAPQIKVQSLVQWGGADGAEPGAGDSGRSAGPSTSGKKPQSLQIDTSSGMSVVEGGDDGEGDFVEAKMNMAELTLTFQRHLAMLVRVEKKKKSDSLRLIIHSDLIPVILSWLTSAESTQDDQRLLRELVVAVKEAALDEAGGLEWLKGVICFYSNRATSLKTSDDDEEKDG